MRIIMMVGLVATVAARVGAAQRTETWLTTLGTDTVAFERFTRSADRLEGQFVVTTPRTRINTYLVTFNPDGSAKQYEFSSKPAVEGPGAQPPLGATVVFGDGTVVVTVVRGGKTDTTRLAAGGRVLPNAFYAWGLFGLAVEAARRAGGDSVVVEQVSVGARQTAKTAIARRGDSLAVDFFGLPMMVTATGQGQLKSVNGARTTVKILARPVRDLDVAKLTEAFAARERGGQVAGILSPRDTINATVKGADVWVDYGRPGKRGRQIVGGIVPLGEVWRTGANAATQIRVSRDVEIQGTRIPAGMYTLWSLPSANAVKLIVNKQTGQWGTAYDPLQDLARFDLEVQRLDAPAERFTIGVVETADGGELRFDWDLVRWVARFRVP